MKRGPGAVRDIYHEELLQLHELLQNHTPRIPFPAGMIRVLRHFRSLPAEERSRILNADITYDDDAPRKHRPTSKARTCGTRAPATGTPSPCPGD